MNNSMTITWAIIKADNGIVTKADCKRMNNAHTRKGKKQLFISAPSKDALIEMIESFPQLDKTYSCFFITDKQFWEADSLNFEAVATKKQLSETINF